ncbi:MAG TPA: hypothetical protein VGX28_02675 [Frankiaceae bacterium]|jgi:hypothetical protein|nr:hypothetical protein [Frankiaceae bacterium]
MLVRSTALAALAAAAALAAGGTTATVVLSASDKGVAASSERTEHAKAGAEHGKSADAVNDDAEDEGTDTAVEAPECPAGVKNHGAYVSSVAKAKAEDAEPGDHGALVSAAAKSDCGKTEGDEGDEDDDADEAKPAKPSKGEGAKSDAAEAGKANASEKGQAGQQLGAARGKSAEHAPARPTR